MESEVKKTRTVKDLEKTALDRRTWKDVVVDICLQVAWKDVVVDLCLQEAKRWREMFWVRAWK
jgi:hypothetical protein